MVDYHYLRHFTDPALYSNYTGWDSTPTMNTLNQNVQLQLDRVVGYLTDDDTSFSFSIMLPYPVIGRCVIVASVTDTWLEVDSATAYHTFTSSNWSSVGLVTLNRLSAPSELATATVTVSVDRDRTTDPVYAREGGVPDRTLLISSEESRLANENRIFEGRAGPRGGCL